MKLLVGLLLVVLLAGCSAEASTSPETPAAPAAEHGAAEGEADAVLFYPPGFPSDSVPMFDGPLLHVAHPGNLWAAWIESSDLVADLATAVASLTAAGYTITASADGYAEATKDDRSLRIVASDDATYGPCLAYTITDNAVEPEDAAEQDAPAAEH